MAGQRALEASEVLFSVFLPAVVIVLNSVLVRSSRRVFPSCRAARRPLPANDIALQTDEQANERTSESS